MTTQYHTLQWPPLNSDGLAGILVHRINQNAIPIHDHLFHEIVYVESGAGDHVTAGPTQKLRPGDLIVIRPHVWHGYHNTRNFTIINCLFTARTMERLAPLLSPVRGTLELLRRKSRRTRREPPVVLHLRPAQRPMLADRLARIMHEEQHRTNGWESSAFAALLDILVATARLSQHQLPDAPGSLPHRTDAAVLDTVSRLEANYSRPPRLADLANAAAVSPAHLSRSFSRRMGMGIIEFVHHLRCEEACRLLRWSDAPIAKIATQVGYDEIAYFSRCFRRQIGQSPRAYRRSGHGED
ncbi:MAG TPA: AraC family transcriptional regulator [Tepidisphaeraceae bacterium]|nr:AraC family transcriptional regulator [Tepidisphaeraceae bacterium]